MNLMNTLTKDEALNALVYLGYLRIRALVETSALHLYGRLPMGIDDMQVPELVSWFLIHFEFDESAQKWILYRDTYLMPKIREFIKSLENG